MCAVKSAAPEVKSCLSRSVCIGHQHLRGTGLSARTLWLVGMTAESDMDERSVECPTTSPSLGMQVVDQDISCLC